MKSALLFAGPLKTTYQAKIIKPDGQPLEASLVNFRFTILDPTGSCVLYVENYSSINMADTGGLISFSLGSGVRSFPVSATTTFSQVFDNSIVSLPCQTAGIYSPTPADNRKIVMQFQDSSGWQTLPAMGINAVPYAMYANSAENSVLLNGKTDTAFVEKVNIPTCTGTDTLRFNGISFSCVTTASSGVATSSTVIAALGYTPADAASFTTINSSVVTITNDLNFVSATLSALSATVSATASQWVTSGTSVNYLNGRVGIGTTSPITALQVSGSARFSNGEVDIDPHPSGPTILDMNVASPVTITKWRMIVGTDETFRFRRYLNPTGTTDTLTMSGTRVGIGTVNPEAILHLRASSTTAAPLKLTSGTLLTSPQSGTIEYDGFNFYVTDGTNTRKSIATTTSNGLLTEITDISNSAGDIVLSPHSTIGGVLVSASTASTDANTGSLVVLGGVGVGGDLNVANSITGVSVTASSAMISPYIAGSTASGGSLVLDSTTHSNKGLIFIAPTEGNVGVGTTDPLSKMHIRYQTNNAVVAGLTVQAQSTSNEPSILPVLSKQGGLTVIGSDNNENNPGQINILTPGYGSASNRGPTLNFGATRSLTSQIHAGVYTPMQVANSLGDIIFSGDNGVNLRSTGAGIHARVATTWAASSTPAYLMFSTTASGTINSPQERMRITDAGQVAIGGTTPVATFQVYASTVTTNTSGVSTSYRGIAITNNSDSTLVLRNLGSGISQIATDAAGRQLSFATGQFVEAMRIDGNQRVVMGLGTTSATARLHVGDATGTVDLLTLQANAPVFTGTSLVMQRSLGTSASPALVSAIGASLGGTSYRGYDGSSYLNAAYIFATTDALPTSNTMPGRLVFGTTPVGASASVERMRINSSGNVGIGISTPTARLHIVSGSGVAGTAPLKFTSGTLLTSPESGTMEYDGVNYYLTDGANTRRAISLGSSAGSIDNASNINSNGNITMTPTGSVVVSSTAQSFNSQTGALVVKGGLGVGGDLYSSGTIVTSSNIEGSAITATSGILTNVIQGNMNLSLNSNGGNVGIGTSNPTQRLHISGGNILYDAAGGNQFTLNDTTSGTQEQNISFNRGGVLMGTIFNNSLNQMTFQTNDTDYRFKTGSNERLRITANGFIGIGTSAPTLPLQISVSDSAVYAVSSITQRDPFTTSSSVVAISNSSTTSGSAAYLSFRPTNMGLTAPSYIAGISKSTSYQSVIAFGGRTGSNSYSERMRIDNETGNVGIGTSTPVSLLNISGATPATMGTVPQFTLTGSEATGASNTGAGILFHGQDGSGTYRGWSSIQGMKENSTVGDTAGYLKFGTRAAAGVVTERMRIDSSGNVGIGTSAPTSLLHLRSTLGSVNPLQIDIAGNGGIKLNRTGASSGSAQFQVTSNGDANVIADRNFSVTVNNSSGATSSALTVDSSGNVGINVGNPYHPLHILGTSSGVVTALIQNSSGVANGDSQIFLGTRGVVGDTNVGASLYARRTDASRPGDTDLLFKTSSGTSLAANMVVKASGAVGIGTTNPSEALEVSGSVKATAFLYTSDQRLKRHIASIPNAVQKIKELRGVEFYWKSTGEKALGFIAQEVEQVFPELVRTDKVTGFKSVQYGNIVGVLVEALKEYISSNEADKDLMKARIAELEKRNNDLIRRLEKLENEKKK